MFTMTIRTIFTRKYGILASNAHLINVRRWSRQYCCLACCVKLNNNKNKIKTIHFHKNNMVTGKPSKDNDTYYTSRIGKNENGVPISVCDTY